MSDATESSLIGQTNGTASGDDAVGELPRFTEAKVREALAAAHPKRGAFLMQPSVPRLAHALNEADWPLRFFMPDSIYDPPGSRDHAAQIERAARRLHELLFGTSMGAADRTSAEFVLRGVADRQCTVPAAVLSAPDAESKLLGILCHGWDHQRHHNDALEQTLGDIIAVAKEARLEPPGKVPPRTPDRFPNTEGEARRWFVCLVAAVFASATGLSRRNHKPDSPVVRFISTLLTTASVPASPHSIADMLKVGYPALERRLASPQD